MARWPRWIVVAGAATGLALVGAVVASNFIGGEKKIQRHITRLYTLDDPRFMDELGVLLGPPFLAGTRVQALLNGEQIFPPMLAAIQAAERSITFETYIYWSGDIGRQFAEALAERARQGVKVHVLLDWVGSAKMDDSLLASMTQVRGLLTIATASRAAASGRQRKATSASLSSRARSASILSASARWTELS